MTKLDVRTAVEQGFEACVEDLKAWLRIPSISALPEHHGDVRKAVAWMRDTLRDLGFDDAAVVETEGLPLVVASRCPYPDKPTVVIYGHGDVQPVDPLNEWVSAPFEPEIRNGKLYARGANDDKGQCMVWLGALRALKAVYGEIPLNVKIVVEHEEETGGEAVDAYVRSHGAELACDAVMVCDTSMVGPTQPSICSSLRGLVYTEITVRGAKTDLHSGHYGGVAPNPLHALALMVAKLKGEDGVIHIPELMAAVPVATADEQAFWKADPLNYTQTLKDEMGVGELVGMNEVSPYARRGLYPTLEVHGIKGGFVGEGAKTVIPAQATAKVSLRLPPNLNPAPVAGWLEAALRRVLPAGHRMEMKVLSAGQGMMTAWDDPMMVAARAAMEAVYGVAPVPMREGGSIPIAAAFQATLNRPVLLLGFGLGDDDLHAPNEKYDLGQLKKGMMVWGLFLEGVGKI
ncbi:MAG: dipeptidase [Alphaproteobacteria bacterium]